MEKLKIELDPYHALTLLSFLDEFKEELQETPNDKLGSLRNAVKEFQDQVKQKLTMDQIDDSFVIREIKRLMDEDV